MRARLLCAAALGAATWLHALAGAACENDKGCKGDRVCSGGQCVDPAAARSSQPATPPASPLPASPAAAPTGAPPVAGYPPPGYPPQGYPPQGYYPLVAGAPAGDRPPPTHRRRVGLLVVGSVLAGLGVIGVPISAATISAASFGSFCSSGSTDGFSSFEETCTDEDLARAGTAALAISLAALGAGIPMIIVGVQKVPIERDRPATGGVTIRLHARRGGLGLAGTF